MTNPTSTFVRSNEIHYPDGCTLEYGNNRVIVTLPCRIEIGESKDVASTQPPCRVVRLFISDLLVAVSTGDSAFTSIEDNDGHRIQMNPGLVAVFSGTNLPLALTM